MAIEESTALLEMRAISKKFHGVVALRHVDLAIQHGEIHAVIGENGAGKSTLMKVLSGVYPHPEYEGEIWFDGELRRFNGIRHSEQLGIVIIHQELALIPQLSIAENLFLGHEQARHGVIDWSRTHERAVELLRQVGLSESPNTRVGDIGVGKQQLVEIAKALAKDVRLLILDEPTASLNEDDSKALLDLLKRLRERGVTCVLISHKLNEIAAVADAITVLRDGASIATMDCREAPPDEASIIRAMVGREMKDRYPKRASSPGEPLFELRDWWVEHPLHVGREAIKGVNLNVRRGEIVGIAGLMGAGRTELAMSVFGRSWGRRIRGSAWMAGHQVDVSNVRRAVKAGMAYVTEDRKALGLVLHDSIARNTSLCRLEGVSRLGVIDDAAEHAVASDFRQRLGTRCSGVAQKVGELSGGNQQKVVLAKWLFTEPDLLILDEPTRGIDVGAKFEIYSLIASLAAEGRGILMISSELPELLGMCDRLYLMNEGELVGEMPAAGATQETVMHALLGAH
ncbi:MULTISPECIES: multiple monosaccharide ABC transporter ATP-binding protein [unclassified Roseateles]|uniref:multiple monosaccharide ABC transporter ATP-binding protein n=1 Tax=unclassified Roseateles TaxID=2626991 RepID=UPI0006F688B7|nr:MULTISPECIES: multiple monosaccharide ABC transporter ATP-binding protein [unclassified Roseateles]KQW49758.1 ABC transporter ATP-binding protein [Pelomonas sp. Root405]KRA76425.1 ABC transporter ATP-binding protein [Pelomonas sp. Root662]